jgi:hypothetical protein
VFGLISKNGKIFVSHDYDKSTPYIFACTLKDHTPNTLLLNSVRKYNCWKTFFENYNFGNVRFENGEVKYVCQELIKSILTK